MSELMIKNANIITLDDQNTYAKSLIVSDGKIVRILDESEPNSGEFNITPETTVLDLNGATILPGFIDTHSHLYMFGQMLELVDCRSPQNKRIEDILEKITEKVKGTEPGKWVMGWGYDDTLLSEKRHLTRYDLDSVSPNHPVFIRHISGHFGAANSKALELAGIGEDILNPHGGFFGRDSEGYLDGVIHEIPALEYIFPFLPSPTEDEQIKNIENAANVYLSKGITTCTDAGVGLDKGIAELNAHLAAVNSGKNPMNMKLMILHHLLKEDSAFSGYTADELDRELKQRTNHKVSLDSAKLFQDGSIQGLTGALREPYFCDQSITGDLLHDQETFTEEILNLHERGFRIAIHGNGDRAIGSILAAFDIVLTTNPRTDHRHRIEHVQTASTEDLNTMQRLGVAASFFINHVYYWGDRHRKLFLGEERASRINPLADAIERDLLFTLHSDCPITPISPLFSVWAAVNRVTSEGNTLGDDQKIDVRSALKAMTSYGAKLNFDEEESGTIEVGKRADFVVLGADPLTGPPMDIKDIPVLATIISGKLVWESTERKYILS
ncbi:amidohydrolase [Pseudalkalibacillus decolorationis]|uniref:amidohydrolase n=1 Tax=Pseudalkalibacillus decolorationis TaxID=163879 RepID=UPI0021495F2A|nr:amidohydrolase [Pseudalkalibacillus decolorationis]